MRCLITGGTGFIGCHLMPHLKHLGPVSVLTRNSQRAYQRLGHDIKCIADLQELNSLDGFDAVINLAGEPIADKRWSQRQKHNIQQSRLTTTQQLVARLETSQQKPKVFISGSAVGYYGDQADTLLDETAQPGQADFASQLCQQWESIATQAAPHTRLCILRTGIVLGKQHGALKKMLPAYQLGVGGPLGSGTQYMPWIHIKDMVRLILFLLESQLSGIVNACAPHPVTNREFSYQLAKTLKRPHLLSTPAWVLKLAMGEMAELLLASQRAIPQQLQQAGFIFRYATLQPALENLLRADNRLDD